MSGLLSGLCSSRKVQSRVSVEPVYGHTEGLTHLACTVNIRYNNTQSYTRKKKKKRVNGICLVSEITRAQMPNSAEEVPWKLTEERLRRKSFSTRSRGSNPCCSFTRRQCPYMRNVTISEAGSMCVVSQWPGICFLIPKVWLYPTSLNLKFTVLRGVLIREFLCAGGSKYLHISK